MNASRRSGVTTILPLEVFNNTPPVALLPYKRYLPRSRFPKRSIEAEQAAIAAGRRFERKPQEAVERLDLGHRGERHDDRSRRACDTKRVRVEMEALGCIDVGEDNDRDNEDGARNESRLQPNVRRSARHQLEDTTENATHHDKHERSHAKNEPVHRGVKTHGHCDGGAAPDKC